MYNITNYSRKQAKKLGVTIRRSGNTKKKIDSEKNIIVLITLATLF